MTFYLWLWWENLSKIGKSVIVCKIYVICWGCVNRQASCLAYLCTGYICARDLVGLQVDFPHVSQKELNLGPLARVQNLLCLSSSSFQWCSVKLGINMENSHLSLWTEPCMLWSGWCFQASNCRQGMTLGFWVLVHWTRSRKCLLDGWLTCLSPEKQCMILDSICTCQKIHLSK